MNPEEMKVYAGVLLQVYRKSLPSQKNNTADRMAEILEYILTCRVECDGEWA